MMQYTEFEKQWELEKKVCQHQNVPTLLGIKIFNVKSKTLNKFKKKNMSIGHYET